MYLLILATLVVLLITLGWVLRTKVFLPTNVDQIIAEIKREDVPELIGSDSGLAPNGNLSIFYDRVKSPLKQGECVFLLHGHTQTLLDFPQHFTQPFLDAGYDVVRIDHRGGGQSSWMENWGKGNKYSLEDMAGDIFAVADHLGQDSFHVVGMSMGGMIAQRMSIDQPNRVKSLTSIMSTGFFNDPKLIQVPKKFLFKFAFIFILFNRGLDQVENVLKFHLAIQYLLKGKGDYTFEDKLVLQKSYYENTKRNGYNRKANYQHSYAITKSGSRYESLKELTVPTLIVHGEDDPLLVFEHGRKCFDIIPNAKKSFIKGMGHHLPKVHCDLFIQDIVKHLDENKTMAKHTKSKINSV